MIKKHKKNTINISILLILLLLANIVLTTLTVSAEGDPLSDSTIDATPEDIYELHYTTITVIAKKDGTVLEGADVNISSPVEWGVFTESTTSDYWISLTTDSTGTVSTQWQAPETPTEDAPIEAEIEAHIEYDSDEITLNTTVTIHPISLDESSIVSSLDDVYEKHNATFTILAKGEYGFISGANVSLETNDTSIFPYSTDTVNHEITDVTDENGEMVVIWQANELIDADDSATNITVKITYTNRIVEYNSSIIINKHPIDFDSSVIEVSKTEIVSDETIDITVTAIGDFGPVSNALVGIDALDGEFSNQISSIKGNTNSSGVFQTEWTAPTVDFDIEFPFTANITYTNLAVDPIYLEINVTVKFIEVIHEFASVDLVANATEAQVGEYIELTLSVLNELDDPVECNATFTLLGGTFVENNADIITVETNSTGHAVVTWNTTGIGILDKDGTIFAVGLSLIHIDYHPSYSNDTQLELLLTRPIYKLELDFTVSSSSITQGENVTIIVFVQANNSQIVKDVTVTIQAPAGVFSNSNNSIESQLTNSSGYVQFTWITEDMVVTRKNNYTLTITADYAGFYYEAADPASTDIEVNPKTPTDNGEEPTDSEEGLPPNVLYGLIFGGSALLVLGGGLGFLFFKSKKSM